jgi:predicted protein tyrosine phosphatase
MPKAINISAPEAREITSLPNDTVLISINEEHEDLHPLKLDRNSSRILTVRFTDITSKVEYKGKTLYPIDYDTSLKILDFINRNLGKNFIVHCAAGISRSAAICLYLHIMHQYELKLGFWQKSHPNKMVLGSLIVAKYQK